MATTYEKARQDFFMLEPGQQSIISMPPKKLKQFRDSIYKLSKRYSSYDMKFKTKLITEKKLQICRVK